MLTQKLHKNNRVLFGVMAVFAVAGIVTLLYSSAATSSKSFQAEAGSMSGPVATLAGEGAQGSAVRLGSGGVGSGGKPRVIIMTDGEHDDWDSFLRLLHYVNDFEIVGIVPTNSHWQQNGHGREWIDSHLDGYAQVLANFRIHDPDYPDTEYLQSKIAIGTQDSSKIFAALPHPDTPGSELILSEIRKNDPRPLYINAWGGSNTAAQALYKLKNSFPAEFEAASSKVSIYDIYTGWTPGNGQDGGWKWITENAPGVTYIRNAAFWETWAYEQPQNPYYGEYSSNAWVSANVINHGPLAAKRWAPHTDINEGDTPAFLWLMDNGLRSYVHPSYGGWGGRFALVGGGGNWRDRERDHGAQDFVKDEGSAFKTLTRWIPAVQNDYAARLDWQTKPFNGANHPPTVVFNGALEQTVSPGATVNLNAQTGDPDGNTLTSKWWQYNDADTAGAVTIANDTSATGASFTVPNEPGKTINIILEVTDTGTPALKHYAHVIFTIQ